MKGVHFIDMGPWPVSVAVIAEKRAYRRFMRQKLSKKETFAPYPPINGGLCTHLSHPDGVAMMVIAVGPQSDRDELAGTLAHEATHAMRWMLEYVGENEPGTESQAYIVGHIVKRGLEALAQ